MDYRMNNFGYCKLQTIILVVLIVIYIAFLPAIIRDYTAERIEINATNATNTTMDYDALINAMRNESGAAQVTLGWANSGPNETEEDSLFEGWPVLEYAARRRSKRQSNNNNLEDSWMDHPNPPHPYATNMWWRLLNHTVRMYASRNCYVCAQFPHSTNGGDWWPHQDSTTAVEMTLVAVTAATSDHVDEVWYLKGENWTNVKITKRVFAQVATVRIIPNKMICYNRTTGNQHLGQLPRQTCSGIFEETSTNQRTRKVCLRCLRKVAVKDPLQPIMDTWYINNLMQPMLAHQYLLYTERERLQCTSSCSTAHVPDKRGTGVIEGYYWLCGYRVYLSLPRNWTGLCALVHLHGGAIILPHENKAIILIDNKRQQKRGIFDFAIESPVPKNHHIWTIAEKLLGVFAPPLVVASLMHQVEITRYELTSFLNTSKIMMEGIREELRGIRLTALQNRLVLDQLTAAQGGVCAMVGETCCTYIPDNDADGHLIEQGIQNITQLTKMAAAEDQESDGFNLDWFSFSKLGTILMLVMCILIPIVILMCCWPCIKQAIQQVTPPVIPRQMVIYSVNLDKNNICENM